MTTEQIKAIYNSHDSEKLFGVLINMSFRKKMNNYDKFNTTEQVKNSISALVEIFKDRGIVFQKMEKKKWVDSDFDPSKSYLKLYKETARTEKPVLTAIGQY